MMLSDGTRQIAITTAPDIESCVDLSDARRNRASPTVAVIGYYPVPSVSRNDRIADHTESMARTVEPVEHAAGVR